MDKTGANVSSLLAPTYMATKVQAALSVLKQHETEFDAIAFRGLSGSVMASVLAFLLGKHLIAVRKEGEPSYSTTRTIEHWFPKAGDKSELSKVRWIICDDAVSSGNTVRAIYKNVTSNGFPPPVAVFCYGTAWGAPWAGHAPDGKYTIWEIAGKSPLATMERWG